MLQAHCGFYKTNGSEPDIPSGLKKKGNIVAMSSSIVLTECLARLKTPPFFISAVGRDHIGQILHLNLKELGVVSSLSWANPSYV